MFWFLGLVGLVIGATVFDDVGPLLGALIGFTFGLLLRLNELKVAVTQLEAKVQQLTTSSQTAAPTLAPRPSIEPEQAVATDADQTSIATEAPDLPTVAPANAPLTVFTAARTVHPAQVTAVQTVPPSRALPPSESAEPTHASGASFTIDAPAQSPELSDLAPIDSLPSTAPRPPSLIDKGLAATKAWLLGGNPVLRIGAVILFLGLAFLLRFTAEQFTFPVEVRYIAVAISAIALLGLGWWLRKRNTNYALILQGTGIAVLYLTIFAALRLHPLISSVMALSLLVSITVFLAILAVQQNSLGLATAAVLGGFAAPILTSSGQGDHVALFTYFALLNAGIFAIAWFKAWRLLNLIGFIGTFGIGLAWGMRAYTPEHFASTEPFLVLFFVMYVAIGLLFTWRKLRDDSAAPLARGDLLAWSHQRGDYLDATTLFGPPIVGFGLQVALVQHIEFAAAFSALGLGLFYMLLAYGVRVRSGNKALLLFETCLALGVIFTSLAIPLGFNAQWTSAAWAVEGAGLLWVGLRQQRPIARGFALLLQVGAALAYLSHIETGSSFALLHGSALGAIMLGAALLFSFWQIRRLPAAAAPWEHLLQPWWGLAGLAFCYLTAPLLASASFTAMAWAVAGVLTLYVALRIASMHFLVMAFAIQLLAGILFSTHHLLGGSSPTGWLALLACAFVGTGLIANMVLAVRHPFSHVSQTLLAGLSLMLIVGLCFLNISIKFVLPWSTAAAVWGASGLLILWLSLLLRQQAAFWFSLVLQCFAGLVVLTVLEQTSTMDWQLVREGFTPLAHMEFWTPLILSCTALCGAWRLHTTTLLPTATQPWPLLPLHPLSVFLLVISIAWWGLAWLMEIARFVDAPWQPVAQLVLGALTALTWTWLALRQRWCALANTCSLLALYGVVVLLHAWQPQYNPLGHWGWLGWTALVAAHYLALHKLAATASHPVVNAVHVLGCWLTLAVLGCTLHYALLSLSEHYNAWRWLGWSVLPTLYLWVMALPRQWGWPFNAYAKAYRFVAAAPLAVGMAIWFWLANALSAGNSAPLPYIPLLNPLEIGLLLCLCALGLWSRFAITQLPHASPHSWRLRQYAIGLSALALLTAAMMRVAHQWAGVPWNTTALLQSMLVQAGLSIIWTLCAIALMIFGHRRALRECWLAGAALIAAVVGKLFFVELGNSGGLERIVSFIAVGVLLLVVGYFAPLPPRRKETAAVAPPAQSRESA